MTVSEAGHKGGERVRELVEEGKELEGEQGTKSESSSRRSSTTSSSSSRGENR